MASNDKKALTVTGAWPDSDVSAQETSPVCEQPEKIKSEVVPKTPVDEPAVLARLARHMPKAIQTMLYGPPDPLGWAKIIVTWVTPDEMRALLSNPEYRGIYTPDKEQLEYAVRMALWYEETENYCSFVEDYSHYVFVRHYGNKAAVFHWDGKEMVWQSLAEFKQSVIDKYVRSFNPKTGELRRMLLSEAWLHSPYTRKYDRVEFLPGADTPINVLNLWRGWPCIEQPNDCSAEPIGCQRFLDHIRDNLCGGDMEVYFYLLGWMADAVQNPHRTSRVALVLQGPQGSGKSLFATCFGELFAPHFAVLSRPDHLTGNFNKHLMDKTILFADEAFFAGNRQHAATLKTLVTSETLFIEPKGVDGFMAPKRFRLIMASNDEHVIRAEDDDRRFLVLRVDAGKNNNSSEYFGAILDEWREGGRDDLFNWLRGAFWQKMLEYDWSAECRPRTRALEQQKDLSLDPPEMAVLNMLREGEPPCTFYAEGAGIFVATRMMVEASRLNMKDEKALGDALRAIAERSADGKPKGVRRMIGGDQRRGFLLPPLAIARQQWEAYVRRKVEWPEDVADWCLSSAGTYDPATPF